MQMSRSPHAPAGLRSAVVAACVAVVLAVGGGLATPASAAPAAGGAPAASSASQMSLRPTSTCPQDAVDQLSKAIQFIQSQTWADRPGTTSVNITPDLIACQVTLNIGHLTKHEEAALQAGAGPRLSIVHRRDYAKPSRILLILWIVFGGSGLVWLWRRYLRQA
jgi:hypothetical protein